MKITLPIIIAALGVTSGAATDDKAIRPFKFSASKEALADMRKRIAATRWSDKETVTNASQDVQLATIQDSRAIGRRTTMEEVHHVSRK